MIAGPMPMIRTRDGDDEILETDGPPVTVIAVRFPEFDEQLQRE